MMPNVFLSYRRDDTAYVAGRLNEHLTRALGKECVFFDVDTIPAGTDFRQVIRDKLVKSAALVALIGPNWVNARDSQGRRRLESHGDYVRQELELAAECAVPIIPVMVGDASVPTQEMLPESLHALPFAHSLTLRPDPHFGLDAQRLVEEIRAAGQRKVVHQPSESQRVERDRSIDEFLRPHPAIYLPLASKVELTEIALTGNRLAAEITSDSSSDTSPSYVDGKLRRLSIGTDREYFRECREEGFRKFTVSGFLSRLRELGYECNASGPTPSHPKLLFFLGPPAYSVRVVGIRNVAGVRVELHGEFMARTTTELMHDSSMWRLYYDFDNYMDRLRAESPLSLPSRGGI